MPASAQSFRLVSPRIISILLLALGLALLTPPAHAGIINVTPAGAVDTTVNGNCSLIEAIQSANTDTAVDACAAGFGFDAINVPAGTYTLTTVFSAGGGSDGNDIGLPLITTPMGFFGAGAASTIIERSSAMGTPAFRIFDFASNGGLDFVDLTVRNGLSPNGAAARYAAMNPSPPIVARCVFANNVATASDGGAINFASGFSAPPPGIPIIEHTTFSGNSAVSSGGAIRVGAGANLVIEDSTFTGNSATDGGAIAHGTLLSGAAGSMACTRCLFSGNTATGAAGAILASGTNLTLTDSFVTGNSAGPTSAGGGLLIALSAVAQIAGTTFSGNTAGLGGGFHVGNGTTATIVNSTFSGNIATDPGGFGGGAILANVLSLTLNNVTITNNSAAIAGGLAVAGNVTFANTILAGNSAPIGPDCSIIVLTLTSMGFNLVGNNTGCNFVAATGDQVGTGASPIDPLLGPLADNGGPDAGAVATPIPTRFPQPGSPALDAGNNVNAIGGAFPACRADDQRDVARPVGPRCDIGAAESSANADLGITKADSPDPVNRGDNLTYILTVTNNGPGGAGAVQVADTLPPGLVFVSATPSQGTCMDAALVVTCNLGILASGGNATINLVVTTTAAGMLTNTATVTTTSNDTDLSNNTDTEDTVVNPVTDISVTKTDSADPVNVGGNITYTVTVTNNGPDDATGVSLTDTLPGGVNFVSATPSQGTCAQAAGLVTCNLGALANGSSATITIVVTTTATGSASNTVTATGDGVDPNPANNTATAQTAVVDFAISAMPASVTVVRGGSANYTITLTPVGSIFPSAINLTVSGLPAFSSGSFQPASVTPNAAPASSTLVITTQAPIFAQNGSSSSSPLFAFGLGLPLFFFGAVLVGPASRRKHWRAALALAILLAVMLLNFGCANGELPVGATGTPVGTFPITITATSGNLTHSTTVDLVVQ